MPEGEAGELEAWVAARKEEAWVRESVLDCPALCLCLDLIVGVEGADPSEPCSSPVPVGLLSPPSSSSGTTPLLMVAFLSSLGASAAAAAARGGGRGLHRSFGGASADALLLMLSAPDRVVAVLSAACCVVLAFCLGRACGLCAWVLLGASAAAWRGLCALSVVRGL